MENNEKARFLGNYIGVTYKDGLNQLIGVNQEYVTVLEEEGFQERDIDIDRFRLPLKPLASISDEDAIGVAKMNRYYGKDPVIANKVGRDMLDKIFNAEMTNYCLPFEAADFLRSKGYALPYMQYSVEQLVSMGWIKLTD